MQSYRPAGLLGVAAVIAAAGCALAGDVIASARDLAPLAALTGRRRWVYALTTWRTALPLSARGAAGAAAYYVLPTGLSRRAVAMMIPSSELAWVSAAAAIALGLIAATWAAAEIVHRGRTWQPGSEG